MPDFDVPAVGRNSRPRPSLPRPGARESREEFWLATARQGFLYDDRSIDEALPDFERTVEHVLNGGRVDEWGRIPNTNRFGEPVGAGRHGVVVDAPTPHDFCIPDPWALPPRDPAIAATQ